MAPEGCLLLLPSSVLESWSTTFPPGVGPGGARRRRLRARRKPAPLLLEARPGLPALLAAPGGAQGGQALLLRAPSAAALREAAPGAGLPAYWLSGWFGLALAGWLLAGFWLSKKRFGFWLAFWLLAGFLAGLAGLDIFLARLAETQLRGKLTARIQGSLCCSHTPASAF